MSHSSKAAFPLRNGTCAATALALWMLASPSAALAKPAAKAQGPHPCEGAAREVALKLLRLQSDGDERASVEGDATLQKPVKAPKGKAKYDVLQVMGFVYKATFRVRVLYLQGDASCARVGMEIVEMPAGG